MTGGTHPYDDLKAYCDGELTLTRRLSVRLHLARCTSCREETQFMKQLGNDLRPSGTATLDPELRERVLTEAANTPRISPAPEVVPAKRRRITLGEMALASVVVVVVAAFIFPIFFKARERARQVSDAPIAASVPAPQEMYKSEALKPDGSVTVSGEAKEVSRAHVTDGATAFERAPAPSPARQFALAPAPPPVTLDSIGEDPLRRVHKEASLTVQVADPEAKSDDVAQMTRDIGGYVGSNTLSTDGNGAKTAELVLNVPEPQFEMFVARVAKLGMVTAKQITGEDITQKVSDADQAQQVLDDEAQRAEARLQLLGRHSRWDDVEQARDLRIQLAQARARLILLKKMATLSSVTVDLTETPKPPAPARTGFLPGLHDTSQQALQSLGNSVGVLMSLAIWILAYAPIWLPVLLISRWAYRTYSQKRDVTPRV